MKLRRSMLFVPGSNAAMLSNSFIYKPDSIMFDLEDAVALKEKDTARLLVAHALQHPLYKDIETVVRVNPLDSEFGVADLNAVVRAGVDVVRMPKTETAQDVIDMDREITEIEKACGREVGSTKMLAAIESPLGITQANQIATASKRLIGIALGAEDYVRNLKTERSPEGIELLFARCSILQAARAAGIQAFDTVYSNANNEEGFLKEAALIKQLGFDGKSLINPRQIELLHNLFAPTQKDVDQAKRIIEAAEEAERQGSGYWVSSPEMKEVDNKAISKKGLEELGPMSFHEKALIVLFVIALFGWIFSSALNVNATIVALIVMVCCIVLNIVSWDDILKSKGGWNTLIWYGGIIGMSGLLEKAQFFGWLAESLKSVLQFEGQGTLALIVILTLSVAVRYLFASGGAYVAAMVPVFATVGHVAGAPTELLALGLLFANSYGGSVTHYGGGPGPIAFGAGYNDIKSWWTAGAIIAFGSLIVHLTIGMAWWEFLFNLA
ncbi:aldolase/citrate lyase family protein [Aggregatibacter actinomycetemcomitans]|uniref:aldolase/citrate lyase family protein n=1 Tax=Aggregatibacter actinomycetemcomitans TaxID=714 RepID=UPI00370958B4